MLEYQKLLKEVLEKGVYRPDRTGTGTISVFGTQSRYNLKEGFPLVTTKKMFLRGVIGELLWFLEGNTNSKYLENKYGVKFWHEWADADGNLGPIYGAQFRFWPNYRMGYAHKDGEITFGTIDQIRNVIKSLKDDPYSRRHVLTTWNPADLPHMNLHPCHGTAIQYYVDDENRLSCHMYQRSGDLFLGVPVNIASYSLLLMMIAQVTGYTPYEFIHTIGDAHLYSNHIEQAKLQISREPLELPSMKINPDVKNIDDFKYEDFELINYNSYPHIQADISV